MRKLLCFLTVGLLVAGVVFPIMAQDEVQSKPSPLRTVGVVGKSNKLDFMGVTTKWDLKAINGSIRGSIGIAQESTSIWAISNEESCLEIEAIYFPDFAKFPIRINRDLKIDLNVGGGGGVLISSSQTEILNIPVREDFSLGFTASLAGEVTTSLDFLEPENEFLEALTKVKPIVGIKPTAQILGGKLLSFPTEFYIGGEIAF